MRCAEASETIQLLPVEWCGLVQGEYMETKTNGLPPGSLTCAAASVPK